MNEAKKENKCLIHNQQDRQRNARRTHRTLEEIQIHNNHLTIASVGENDSPTLTSVSSLNSMDENLSKQNEDDGCGIETERNCNEIFGNSYQNPQKLFSLSKPYRRRSNV